jgi:hypothetical protein
MLRSTVVRDWSSRAGLLALGLGAALLLPASGYAQAPEDAKQRDKEIAELKAKIDTLLRERAVYENLASDPSTPPDKKAEYTDTMANLRAQLAKLMKDRAGAEFAGYAQDAEKEAVEARLKALQGALAQQADRVKEDETARLKDELKKIEAVRQQRAKEVQDLEAKIRALSEKLKAGQPARPAGGDARPQPEWRFEFAPAQHQAVEEIILRKVDGKWEVVNPKALQPEQPRRVEFVPAESGGRRVILNPVEVRPGMPGQPASPASRIDELEKKIDRALQQIEQLRRERNRSRSGAALTPEATPEAPKVIRVILDDEELQNLVLPAGRSPGVERK